MGIGARRAYVDAPVPDLAATVSAARSAADRWGLGRPTLHRHGMNAIFIAGDTVLRVARPSVPATASIELARFLDAAGVHVPSPLRDDVVVHEGLSVTAWELVESTGDPVDWFAVGELVRRVHSIDPAAVPVTVPVPHPSALPWWDFDSLLERAASSLDRPAADGLRAAVERHRGWERLDELVVCHGDVHPGNVLQAAGGPVLLDWDLLCHAPAGWDHAPLLSWHERWGGPADLYDAYARGYGRSFAEDGAASTFAELRLVAATLMRVLAAVDDPGARPEAERRLQYWRGDPDAVPWTAQ